MTSGIYIASDASGLVKIGESGDIERRVNEHRTSNPTFEVLRTIEVDGVDERRALEGALHAYLEPYRASGCKEWFERHPVVLGVVKTFKKVWRARRKGIEVSITEKQFNVFWLIKSGATNAEIGKVVEIGVETVKTHVQHLLGKTGAKNRTELVACWVCNEENGIYRLTKVE